MNKTIKTRFLVGLAAVSVFAAVIGTLALLPLDNVIASDAASIDKKVLVNGLQYCYDNSYYNNKIDGQAFQSNPITTAIKKKGTIYIRSSVGGDSYNCRQVFQELGSTFGKTPSKPEDLGYVMDGSIGSDESQNCVYMTYMYKGGNYTTNTLCARVVDDVISSDLTTDDSSSPLYLFYSPLDYAVQIYHSGDSHWLSSVSVLTYTTKWSDFVSSLRAAATSIKDHADEEPYGSYNYVTWFSNGDIKESTSSSNADVYYSYSIEKTDAARNTAKYTAINFYTGASNFSNYKFDDQDKLYLWDEARKQMISDGAITTIEGLCYPSKDDALAKAGEDNYIYYDDTNNTWCPVQVHNHNATYNVVAKSYTNLTPADVDTILGLISGHDYDTDAKEAKKKKCTEKAENDLALANAMLNGQWATPEEKEAARRTKESIETNSKAYPDENGNPKYWIENSKTGAISCLAYTALDGSSSVDPNDNNQSSDPVENPNSNYLEDPDGSDSGTDIRKCKNAISLGWILCPTLDVVGKATLGLYEQVAETWITIDGDEVNPDKEGTGEAVYRSWTQFRDYANIGFAILFAVVVFSQVTGIGLSNYSIKKMLPTLIMIAVLVNISFFICQIAVDVTNIIGVGIGDVFMDLGATINQANGHRGAWDTAGYIASGLLQAAGIGVVGYFAAPVLAPIVVTSVGTIVITVLITLVGALVSLVFMMILLALRKAFIFALIMISPLAFICYAFPNTKSLFDKWKKLFTSLLLVFPICQILVYGGQAMSLLMMSSNESSFFFQLTAMLMSIVPVFFIPMVLRSSMSMLGNIGTRVSQMGARLGGAAKNRIGNSNLAKRTSVGLNAWGAKKLTKSGLMQIGKYAEGSIRDRLQTSGRARLANALTQASDLQQSDYRAQNITSDKYMDTVNDSAKLKADEEFGDNFVAGMFNGSILKEDGSRYDMNDLRSVDHDGVDGDMVKLYSRLLASTDEDDTKRLKGLTKHLLNIKGGKGLAAMAASMRRRGGSVFKEDGSLREHDAKERTAFNAVAKYATNNEKWNMMIKRWDPNMTNLLADGAMDNDDKVKNRGTGAWAYYNIGASGKSTPAQIINHDDSYFDGLRNVFGSEAGYESLQAKGDVGNDLRAAIAAYQGNAQEVFDNPRVYSQAGGALRDIQSVSDASQVYAATVSRLEQEAREHNEKTKFAEMRKQVQKEMEGKYKQMAARTSINVEHDNPRRIITGSEADNYKLPPLPDPPRGNNW